MIIQSGFIIFLGLVFIGVKLPPKTSLKLLGWPITLDIVVTVLTFMMHMGTFSGVMAAAVAGLMCSGFTSAARYLFGYIESNVYYPGKVFNISHKLGAAA